MDSKTGQLYSSVKAALADGVLAEDLVALEGTPEAVERIAESAQQRGATRKAGEPLMPLGSGVRLGEPPPPTLET